MSEPAIYPVPEDWARTARVNRARYENACRAAETDPDGFWRGVAERLEWMAFPTRIKDVSFNKADFRIRWFEDGFLNVSVNCIDRHLPERRDDVAIIWEGDDPADSAAITYGELHTAVCRMRAKNCSFSVV